MPSADVSMVEHRQRVASSQVSRGARPQVTCGRRCAVMHSGAEEIVAAARRPLIFEPGHRSRAVRRRPCCLAGRTTLVLRTRTGRTAATGYGLRPCCSTLLHGAGSGAGGARRPVVAVDCPVPVLASPVAVCGPFGAWLVKGDRGGGSGRLRAAGTASRASVRVGAWTTPRPPGGSGTAAGGWSTTPRL